MHTIVGALVRPMDGILGAVKATKRKHARNNGILLTRVLVAVAEHSHYAKYVRDNDVSVGRAPTGGVGNKWK